MNHFKLKPIVIAVAGALVLAQAAQASTPPAPNIREEITTSPGRSISPADEQMLSSVANKVLHRVAQARDALMARNVDQAKKELGQADVLMNIIQKSSPTTVITDKIWTADNKLKYENTEEVRPASIPIYASLGQDDIYSPSRMKLAQALPPKTGKDETATAQAAKPAAQPADIEDRFDMLFYQEMDLPLNMTRHFIAIARDNMSRNQLARAADALQAVLDNVDFINVYLPEPLLAAESNLQRAHDHYSAGALPEARADVHAAIAQLTKAEKTADAGSKADVQALLDDATALQGRIDHNEPNLGNDFKQVWHRTKALADRAVESTAVGWERLRAGHDDVRKDLIEAKRYVVYADIDANIAREPAKATADLTRAQSFLQQAEKSATGKDGAMVYIKDAKAVVDSLLSGQAKPGPGEMNNLKAQLSQAIGDV